MAENGTDYILDHEYSYQDANEDKNHNRMSDPVANLSDPQPGMILSDSDDDKLYHVGLDSDEFDEILQENRSADAYPTFYSLDLQQLTDDDPVLRLRSSGDVAHGVTDVLPTDVYAEFKKYSNANGGLFIRSATEGSGCFGFYGIETTNDTGKTNSDTAAVMVYAAKKSAATIGDLDADANAFGVIVRRGSAFDLVFIVDEDGDVYHDGGLNSFDEFDDPAACHDLAQYLATLKTSVMKPFLKYNRDALRKMGVISDGDMISYKNTTALILGAIGQLYQRNIELENKIAALTA